MQAAFASGWLSAAGTTYLLIVLAEMGDKSQLVCMTLAARHRAGLVFAGAVAAFLTLNLLAVLFGAGIAAWLPREWLLAVVGVLFVGFGVQSLRAASAPASSGEDCAPQWHRGALVTTFVLITMAEFGDKTQLTVAGLGSAANPVGVWLGASLALATTSALGIWLGGALLARLPEHWLHRVAGGLFIALGALAILSLLLG